MDLEQTAKRRRGQELEVAILDAGWQQLLDGGYGSFTIDAVAERAGTSRSVVYRRWDDREALLEAALAHGLRQGMVEAPDTGSLRGDMIELLHRSNEARAPLAPLMSVLIGSHFSESGGSFADLRRQMIGTRTRGALDDVIDRAAARGEIDPARLTPRVRTVAFDLFRHHLLLNLTPMPDDDIVGIVDEIFLPLVRPTPTEPGCA
ncbi:TetR/AcrR family transcriptional regulator [Microbacterium ulmi]|uniref:TetR/AcrR family transcriptional regulator n=1 Tax=Microbacterium ulmi TaxID=179095 RepID=A0A7Y2M0N5_9MICO|nr:TetR/AcrR family transcriptional regulator [Microbacterium ulmi]NII70960.1 AcrR family transcriptional regulator [Microbacterium ulmi]NNH04274.1 TetR/AcrR family transcriptional regulator [Microbacterium ulmi]